MRKVFSASVGTLLILVRLPQALLAAPVAAVTVDELEQQIQHLQMRVNRTLWQLGVVVLLSIGITLGPSPSSVLARQKAPVATPKEKEGKPEAASEEEVEKHRLEEMVVTAAKKRQERLDSLMPITGVTREQFEVQPDKGRLGDVINRMPGVFMGGPPGENKDIRLRGMDKEFTRFEFDGIQLPGDGEKREFNVNRISPFAVGEVKILRNPTSEFESDGIAGRVVADLRPIPKQLELDFKVEGGGIDTLNADQRAVSFGFGNRINPWLGFNLFLDYNRFPLEKKKKKTTLKADGTLKARETENEEKPGDSLNTILDTAYFYDGGEVHFKPLWFRLEEEKNKSKLKTEPGKDPTLEQEDEEEERTTWGVSLTNEHHWLDWMLESDVSYAKTRKTKSKTKPAFKDKGSGFKLDKTEFENEKKEDEFWQIRSKLTAPFEFIVPQTLKTGFHFRFRDRFRDKGKTEVKPDGKTTDKTKPKDDYTIEEDYWAGFIQDEFNLSSAFAWNFGLRIEHARLMSASGEGISRERTFTDPNPSTHARYHLTDHLSVNGAVSRSVNRPKFDEIAPFEEEKSDRFVQGNPDLEPATAINFDLGITYADENGLLAVNLFHKEVNGVLEEVNTGIDKAGKDIFRIENVGDGWTRGLELEQRVDLSKLLQLLKGLSLWANESFFDSELKGKDGVKRPFNDQPDFISNFGVDYANEATGISFDSVAKFRDDLEKFKAVDDTEIEDERWSIDLSVRKKLTRNISLFFNALNITDAKKEKTKFKPKGEREFEMESTGPVFIVGIQGEFK